MPNILPYLIILIFAAAQVGFLFLLRRQQDTLDYLFDEFLDQGNYAQQQDRTYAKLWNALQAILKELSQTIQVHDQMAEHYGDMTAVAEGALHSKLDEQRRYAEYLDTRLTAILDEVCQRLQTSPPPPAVAPRKPVAKTKRRRVAK